MNNPEIMRIAEIFDNNPELKGFIKAAKGLDREHIKKLVLIILSDIGDEELREKIQDNGYNDFARECFSEELENRRQK